VLFFTALLFLLLRFFPLDAGLAGAGWVACAQDIYELDLYHKIWSHAPSIGIHSSFTLAASSA